MNMQHGFTVEFRWAVVLVGTINASLGGLVPVRGNVALLGRHVENNGLISAKLETSNSAA